MSWIGPRPDLPDALEVYEKDECRKLDVLPGITGYSQAYYRNSIEIHERFKQDVYYVDNISFWLDVKIFFMTIKTVVFRKGVYRDESGKTIIEKKEKTFN